MRAFVVQRAVGLRRCGGIFHAAENEVGDRDLRVTLVGIIVADHALEDFDHLRRLAERAFTIAFASGGNVIPHRYPCALFDFREVAGDHRDEIRCVRDVLFVAEDRLLAVVAAIDEDAVGEREESPRYDDRRRRRLLLVRIVERGKPVACILILALRPYMREPMRIGGRRPHEIDPATCVFDAIGNRERYPRTRGERLRETNDERIARRGEAELQRAATNDQGVIRILDSSANDGVDVDVEISMLGEVL